MRRLTMLIIGASLGCLQVCGAQQKTPPAAALDEPKQAVALVSRKFTPNPFYKDGSQEPLQEHGSWAVRESLSGESVTACSDPGAHCRTVLYRAGTPQVTCTWTVLFPSVGEPSVVSVGGTTAEAMLRTFASGSSEEPLLVTGRDVVYPPFARAAYESGTVTVALYTDARGHVRAADLLSGPAMLRGAALDPVQHWVFEPFVVGGTAMGTRVMLEVDFKPGGFVYEAVRRK